MARPPKPKDIKSPKRGAFPVPESVLANAVAYRPQDRLTKPLPGLSEKSAPNSDADRSASSCPERENDDEETGKVN